MPTASGSLLSPWIVLPVVAAVMLFVAWHIVALHDAPMPPSRRRIRTASGLVMLLVAPLLAYALGVLTTANPRTFVMVWLLIVGLLGVIIALAGLDVVNTARLHLRLKRSARRQLADDALDLARQRRQGIPPP